VFPHLLQLLNTLQSQWKEGERYPQVDFFSFFSEKEKTYLESHIQEFSQSQIQLLEKTINIQDIPPHEFQWKDQYNQAYQWCSHFRIPCIKPK
jgi:hypothetical protein